MAEHSFPYDAVEDAQGEPDRVYYAEDFRRVFQAFFTNGLFPNPSTNLQVLSLNSNMVVTVQPGVAHINGATYTNDEPIEFALDTANANYNRLDLIVLRLEETERTCHVYYRAGTPSGNPQEPPLYRSADVWELKLAKITVRSGTQIINQADITDTRLDATVCGIVAAIPDHVDTSTIFGQYNDAWEQVKATMAANESAYNAWYDLFTTTAERLFNQRIDDFDAWFAEKKAAIFDAKYFDFDNLIYRKGYTYTYSKADNVYTETIKNTLSNEVYATRISTKTSSTEWTIQTICIDQEIDTMENWTKIDGTWKGAVS